MKNQERRKKILEILRNSRSPVTGDQLYGREKDSPIARQALHARRIVFKHPVSGETIDAEAPIPDDMAELLKKLRRREY